MRELVLAPQPRAKLTDNFTRADGGLGINWVSPIEIGASNAPGTMKIASNQVGAVNDNQHSFGYWLANPFTNNQYAQVKVATIGAWVGACVRAAAGVQRFYYGFVFAANDYRLYKYWDDVHTQLVQGSALTWSAGDILKVEVIGSAHPITLNMYRNGVLALTWTSASSADVKNGGSPGVGIFSPTGLNLRLDDWEGGTIDTTAATVTDNFNRANGALGSNWTPNFYTQTNFAIASNAAGVSVNSNFALAFYSGATFKDDQYAQYRYIDVAGNPASTGLILRADAVQDKCYVALIQDRNNIQLYARWAGNFNALGVAITIPTLVTGDIIRLQVSGITHPFFISLIINGVWKGGWPSVDNTWARSGGSPGIIMYQNAGNTLSIDDWGGGNL